MKYFAAISFPLIIVLSNFGLLPGTIRDSHSTFVCIDSYTKQDILEELIRLINEEDPEGINKLLERFTELDKKGGRRNATPLYYAVNKGNVEIAKLLILKGADVHTYEFEGITLLAVAVSNNDVDMAGLLLAKGADPKAICSEGMEENFTPLSLAMENGNREILDLFIASDKSIEKAEIEMGLLEIQLRKATDRNDFSTADSILSDGNISLENSMSILLRFTYGSADYRELIRKYGPDDMAEGRLNVLDYLINEGGITWDYREDPGCPSLEFPLATTFLHHKSQPFRYAPGNAFDGNPGTSWVEGVDKAGIGQKIAFEIGEDAKILSILPGFGVGKYFKKNNRIKRANLSIYVLVGSASQFILTVGFLKEKSFETELFFEDQMDYQDFEINLPALSSFEGVPAGGYIAVIEILEVFPGTDWDDACIAEIKIE